MTVDQVLKLTEAGWSKDEILKLTAAETAGGDQHEKPEENPEKKDPKPEPKKEPEKKDPEPGPETTLNYGDMDKFFAQLTGAVTELKTAVEASNIINAGGKLPEADDVFAMAAGLLPGGKKEDK